MSGLVVAYTSQSSKSNRRSINRQSSKCTKAREAASATDLPLALNQWATAGLL